MSTRVVRERIDPRLTAALFSNYRTPIDALLELIDNAVDSRIAGRPLEIDLGTAPRRHQPDRRRWRRHGAARAGARVPPLGWLAQASRRAHRPLRAGRQGRHRSPRRPLLISPPRAPADEARLRFHRRGLPRSQQAPDVRAARDAASPSIVSWATCASRSAQSTASSTPDACAFASATSTDRSSIAGDVVMRIDRALVNARRLARRGATRLHRPSGRPTGSWLAWPAGRATTRGHRGGHAPLPPGSAGGCARVVRSSRSSRASRVSIASSARSSCHTWRSRSTRAMSSAVAPSGMRWRCGCIVSWARGPTPHARGGRQLPVPQALRTAEQVRRILARALRMLESGKLFESELGSGPGSDVRGQLTMDSYATQPKRTPTCPEDRRRRGSRRARRIRA